VTGARTRGVLVNSVEDFPLDFVSITRRTGGDETQAATFKADASHDFEVFAVPLTFSTGFMYTDREKKSKENNFTATRAQLIAAGVPVPEITAAGSTAAFDALFLNKEFLGKIYVPYDFRYHSKSAIEAFALDLQKRGIATAATATDLQNFWKVGEEITAAYAMGKFDFDWGDRRRQAPGSSSSRTTAFPLARSTASTASSRPAATTRLCIRVPISTGTSTAK